MTEISKLMNTTSADLIAQKLDAADGKKDGKIEASIWNEFVKEQGGNEIQNHITLKDAINSIKTYVQKAMKTEGKTEAEATKATSERADNIDPFEEEIETSEEVNQATPYVVDISKDLQAKEDMRKLEWKMMDLSERIPRLEHEMNRCKDPNQKAAMQNELEQFKKELSDVQSEYNSKYGSK